MHDQINKRLQELKTEYEEGKGMLAEMETKQANLERTLLRISGAIQVLEELLAADSQPATTGPVPLRPRASSGASEGAESLRNVNASQE